MKAVTPFLQVVDFKTIESLGDFCDWWWLPLLWDLFVQKRVRKKYPQPNWAETTARPIEAFVLCDEGTIYFLPDFTEHGPWIYATWFLSTCEQKGSIYILAMYYSYLGMGRNPEDRKPADKHMGIGKVSRLQYCVENHGLEIVLIRYSKVRICNVKRL